MKLAYALAVLLPASLSHAQEPRGTRSASLSGLLGAAPAGRSAQPELETARRELALLSARRDAPLAAEALRLAGGALARAVAARAEGRADVAERKLQLAWAALTLASRQLAAATAAHERAAAERRASRAEAELRAEQSALEQVRARRAEAK
jgi:hypothetical protein